MGSDKKKIAIIGVSSILLVAAVIGAVTYGVQSHRSNATQEVSASSKAVQTVCGVTDYKETCEKSLSNATDNMDVKQLIHMALESAIESVRGVINSSSALSEAAKNPSVSEAFSVCNVSLDLSIETLQKSINEINAPLVEKEGVAEFLDDVTTWLSGTISLQEACLDAFADNSTGETGVKVKELMKSTRELSSNGLAMIQELSHVLTGVTQIPASRRLLENNEDMFPSEHVRRLLRYNPNAPHHPRIHGGPALKPNAIVSPNGRGRGMFRSIQAAINTAPMKVNQTFVILVKAGVYHEYIEIPKYVYNVFLLGEGPERTRIIGNKNFVDGVGTWKTATVGVNGDNFIAKDISFENNAGSIKHQAVALRVSADKAIFYNVHMDGFQDTLYTVSGRQYFRDCTISGTIDFIFGDAASVFQNCNIVVRKPLPSQSCMVTAQGRADARSNGATVLQNCNIVPAPGFFNGPPTKGVFLGRPWKQYSRTLIMQSFIDGFIAPEGWSPWTGNFALDTLKYGEYQNRGAGSNTARRVRWRGIQHITPQVAMSFTPGTYLTPREWLQPSGIPFVPGMMRV